MKKVFIGLLLVLSVWVWGEDKGILQIGLQGNLSIPADIHFQKVYGKSVLIPELNLSYRFHKNIFAYASYGFFNKWGKTEELQLETKTQQNIFSFGAGYVRPLGSRFEVSGSLGLALIDFDETVFEETVSSSSVGIRLDLSAGYKISKCLFAAVHVGYVHATDKVEFEEETETIRLAGFRAGLTIALRLHPFRHAAKTNPE